MKKYLLILFAALLVLAPAVPAFATRDVYNDGKWKTESDGDMVPITDSSYDIGASGYEVDNIYVDGIILGGVEKNGWGSIVSPMTDAATYVNPTDAGAYLRLYDAGYIRHGDASTAGDYYSLYSGDTDAYYAGLDDTNNVYVVGHGSTVGTTPRLMISRGATTAVTVGDGVGSYDKYIVFDGSVTDYVIGYDDTNNALSCGRGATPGSIECFRVDTTTAPKLMVAHGIDVIGDADFDLGSADVDDFTFTTDGTGDAEIVLPNNSIGDDEIDWSGLIADSDFEINGDTPSAIIGDGDTEDNMVVFDGVTDFSVGVDHTRSRFEITNGLDMDQTCAISIDANEDVYIDSGSLQIMDDEKVYLGTDHNWLIEYDESVDNQLLIHSATTAAAAITDPLVEIIVAATPTANQQVFGVAKGLQASNTALLTLDEDGDLSLNGNLQAVTDIGTTSSEISNVYLGDDKAVYFGAAQDWSVNFDDSVDDQLIFLSATNVTTAVTDPLVQFIATNTPGMQTNQQVFGVAYGTQAADTDLLTIDKEGDAVLTGDFYIKDDKNLYFGTSSDYYINFDDSVADQLLFTTTATVAAATADPMYQFLVGATPISNQNLFGIAKGTQASNTDVFVIDEDGDGIFAGDLSIDGGTIATNDARFCVKTGTTNHRYKYYGVSYNDAATLIPVVTGGASALRSVGLAAGVADIGSAEGYVAIGDAADHLIIAIPMPDTFIDTGTQADLVLSFDIAEQSGLSQATATVNIYQRGAATANIIAGDTIVIANGAARAFNNLQTNSTGIGNDVELDEEDTIVIDISPNSAADDFNVYGVRMKYRYGLEASQ